MSVRYAVIFEQAERNWAAYVPDLPGCITTGSTLEETERNIGGPPRLRLGQGGSAGPKGVTSTWRSGSHLKH
jgi:hypothetical protein